MGTTTRWPRGGVILLLLLAPLVACAEDTPSEPAVAYDELTDETWTDEIQSAQGKAGGFAFHGQVHLGEARYFLHDGYARSSPGGDVAESEVLLSTSPDEADEWLYRAMSDGHTRFLIPLLGDTEVFDDPPPVLTNPFPWLAVMPADQLDLIAFPDEEVVHRTGPSSHGDRALMSSITHQDVEQYNVEVIMHRVLDDMGLPDLDDSGVGVDWERTDDAVRFTVTLNEDKFVLGIRSAFTVAITKPERRRPLLVPVSSELYFDEHGTSFADIDLPDEE